MEEKIFKLQLLVEGGYIDCWFDVSKVTGFFIPLEEGTDEKDLDNINLFLLSEGISVKREKHIEEYLINRFVNKTVRE